MDSIKKNLSHLILGGHSFIPEMGNDPAVDADAQLAVVQQCLNHGITSFDTTYEPERVALGNALQKLGRRKEAQIIAWNFFHNASTGKYIVPPSPFQTSDIDRLLEQLKTDYIDFLVVHPLKEKEINLKQYETAQNWLRLGYVQSIGTWNPSTDFQELWGDNVSFEFMVTPCNVTQPNSEKFKTSKGKGWRTLATSPFHRGWLLDEMVDVAAQQSGENRGELKARLSDALIRYSVHSPHVDHLIIGIRKTEWILPNLQSVAKGSLSKEDANWILGLKDQVLEIRKKKQEATAGVSSR